MPLFEWNDSYSVQHDWIDRQHQQLFKIINELYLMVQMNQAADAVGGVIDALIEYTRTHFAVEEDLMRLHNYPDYEAHKAVHDALLARVIDYDRRYRNGEATVAEELLPFLMSDWLTNHIAVVDQKYVPCLVGE